MTKTDIFSGFLGAGKTTLIRKLISEGYKGEKIVLIENEFGEIAIDGGFLRDAGVEITEMNSGCICCTLVGDFTKSLKKVMQDFNPDRIIIEPSGVGKLSDVAAAVQGVEGIEIGAKVTVVDAGKCKVYMRNFGEFYNDQVASADLVIMSRTGIVSDEKVLAAAEMLKEINPDVTVITTPWDKLSGAQIIEAMDRNALHEELKHMEDEEHEHHHHHHEHGEECTCGCHDHDDDDDDDDDEEHEHHHHHHHEHGEECTCGCHDHDDEGEEHEHHHHHHADEIFTSWGTETARKFTADSIKAILDRLGDEEKYGIVLRAKGIVDASDGEWIYFDYVPGESDIRRGSAEITGRFCVIGSKLNEQALKELFTIE